MKPGYKTSEFWLSLTGILAIAFPQLAPFVGVAQQVVASTGGDMTGPAAIVGGIVGTYNVGRSYYKAKSGTELPKVAVVPEDVPAGRS